MLGRQSAECSLPDVRDWKNFDSARQALEPNLARNRAAERCKIESAAYRFAHGCEHEWRERESAQTQDKERRSPAHGRCDHTAKEQTERTADGNAERVNCDERELYLGIPLSVRRADADVCGNAPRRQSFGRSLQVDGSGCGSRTAGAVLRGTLFRICLIFVRLRLEIPYELESCGQLLFRDHDRARVVRMDPGTRIQAAESRVVHEAWHIVSFQHCHDREQFRLRVRGQHAN
jgi:hypothetical protein